jgi:hypothetical protein
MQGVLWSDPATGREHNGGVSVNGARGGAGSLFGEDVAADFLRRSGLVRLIRSHQCVDEGWERVSLESDGSDGLELYTVFSAAAYPRGQGSNRGALLRLRAGGAPPEAIAFDCPVSGAACDERLEAERQAARRGLGALIRAHRGRLQEAFAAAEAESDGGRESSADATASNGTRSAPAPTRPSSTASSPSPRHKNRRQTNRLSVAQWAHVLRSTLSVQIDWEALQPSIAPTVMRAAANSAGHVFTSDTGLVDYQKFLGSALVTGGGREAWEASSSTSPSAAGRASGGGGGGGTASAASWQRAMEVEEVFQSLNSLRAVLEMLDLDRNGVVSREEFRQGLQLLASHMETATTADRGGGILSSDADPDSLFDAIDTDGSGEITMAELAEAFRVNVVARGAEGRWRPAGGPRPWAPP